MKISTLFLASSGSCIIRIIFMALKEKCSSVGRYDSLELSKRVFAPSLFKSIRCVSHRILFLTQPIHTLVDQLINPYFNMTLHHIASSASDHPMDSIVPTMFAGHRMGPLGLDSQRDPVSKT